MSAKKIAVRLLIVFLCPYIISIFWSSDSLNNTDISVFTQEQGTIQVIIPEDTGSRQVSLENYILGILPSVMPVTYEPEALKAQAVLLRTQFMKEYRENGKVEARDDLTWMSEQQMKSLWGAGFEESYARLKQAVEDTRGLYLLYNGKPILSSYFRVSNGQTRNGSELFGSGDFAYLKSVVCEMDFTSDEYLYQTEMKTLDFCRQLNIFTEDLDTLRLFEDEAGYCTSVSIMRKQETIYPELIIGGEEFRSLFGLPSAAFELQIEKEKVRISVKGTGHGLGMSQYAANEMAKSGQDFMDILLYFFTDIAFDKFE